MPARILPIAVVARETGISKDLLRKWEARYGFPQPTRSEKGTRGYTLSQVATLREVKRFIDSGMRPGEAVLLCLNGKPTKDAQPAAPANRDTVSACLEAIHAHNPQELHAQLDRCLMSQGITAFIAQTAAPLTVAVGEAWMQGSMRVYEEHLFSSTLKAFLAEIHRRLQPTAGGPRILLATPPGELHTLGLEMVRALIAEAGGDCIFLGAQTPLSDLAEAAVAYRVAAVALSFSAAYPHRLLSPTLHQSRVLIPSPISIWVGGAGALSASQLPSGVEAFVTATDAIPAFHALARQAQNGAHSANN